jgi:uncharacterized protein
LNKLSIIIPTLNEAANLATTIQLAQQGYDIEIIVVDGGSQDQTVTIAQSLRVQILSATLGRANQMNAGAKVATGNILLFLHADTHLPWGFDTAIRQTLENDSKLVAGAFELKIDDPRWIFGIIEKLVNWRSRFFSLPYGDQAMFLKTKTFWQLGGFANLPIMEDFQLVQRLQKQGKIAIIPLPVVTSARRWQKLGVCKTTLINQLIIIAYFFGVPPHQIAEWYRHNHRTKARKM